MHIELKCNGCKRNHVLPQESLDDVKLVKRCPHCQSSKIRPTGNIGFVVTQERFQEAYRTFLDYRNDGDAHEVEE